MRTAARSAVLLLSLFLAACGQVEPVLLSVSMPDCTYLGPVDMEPGDVSLSLTLNGLGNARVLLVELTDNHSYDDLEVQLASGGWEDRPDWSRAMIDIELSDTQGIDGEEGTSTLHEGEFAVVCIDLSAGVARVASPLSVEESVDGLDDDRHGDRGQRP